MDGLPTEPVTWAMTATTLIKMAIDIFTRGLVLPNWARPLIALVTGWVVVTALVLIAELAMTTKVGAEIFIAGLVVVALSMGATEAQNLRKKA